MDEHVHRNFNRVLGVQLAAVQQHFIHVLMLRAWDEEAAADRIASIDAVDLPNAMRIVDYLVSAGHVPTLASDRRTLAAIMPGPGDSLHAVCAAEKKLEDRMGDVLASVERELLPYRGDVPIQLVTIPMEARAAYRDWLQPQLEHPCDEVRPSHLTDQAKRGLDSLFANLMVMIDQTLVHAFVHWHRGEFDLADSVWEMSGAAMMHATAIVHVLARRHVAPDPAGAVTQDHVAPPCVVSSSPDSLGNDRVLADRCRAAARRAAVARQEADLAAACSRIEAYYGELTAWRPGQTLPGSTIPAPISSGFFASTCGAEAPDPLHRRRSRPELAGLRPAAGIAKRTQARVIRRNRPGPSSGGSGLRCR